MRDGWSDGESREAGFVMRLYYKGFFVIEAGL